MTNITAKRIIETETYLVGLMNEMKEKGTYDHKSLYPIRDLLFNIKCSAILAKDENFMYVIDPSEPLKLSPIKQVSL